MGKHGVFDATRVQLPYLCYIGGESITNPDNWKVPLPTTATVVQIGSEDGECHYALDGNFAQDNSPGYIAADGERMIGPIGGGSMQTLHLHAPDGIVHLQYYRECGRGRNERAEFQYYEKVLNLDPIAYWPLWEGSGTVAQCLVNPAQNGTYNSDVSGWPPGTGIGDGNTAPGFDGANDFINVFSAAFQGVFNGAEGTICAWARVTNAGIWVDGTARRIQQFAVDGNNRIRGGKTAANTIFWDYSAGAVNKFGGLAATPTAWFHWAATWSAAANTFQPYYNAAAQAPFGALGVWAGNLAATLACIGSDDTAGANKWSGWLAHVAVWDRPLGLPEIVELATV